MERAMRPVSHPKPKWSAPGFTRYVCPTVTTASRNASATSTMAAGRRSHRRSPLRGAPAEIVDAMGDAAGGGLMGLPVKRIRGGKWKRRREGKKKKKKRKRKNQKKKNPRGAGLYFYLFTFFF